MTEIVKNLLPLNIQMFAENPEDEKEPKQADEKSGANENDGGEQEKAAPEKKYTDDEANAISMKNERKAVRDALKKLGYKIPINATKEEIDVIIGQATTKKEDNSKDDEPGKDDSKNAVADIEKQNKYINAELKLALFQANIKKEKIARAINLIDKSKILDDGEIDPDKLEEEIASLTKEWSELLDNKKEDSSSVGFVIGGDGKEEKKTNSLDDIERVMGIKKGKE